MQNGHPHPLSPRITFLIELLLMPLMQGFDHHQNRKTLTGSYLFAVVPTTKHIKVVNLIYFCGIFNCRTRIARNVRLQLRRIVLKMSFIYKYITSAFNPFVKPCDILNLAVWNIFYIQLYMESTFTYNLGLTYLIIYLNVV